METIINKTDHSSLINSRWLSKVFCLSVIGLVFITSSCQQTEKPSGPTEQAPTSTLFSFLPSEQTGIQFRNDVQDVKGNNFLLYEYFYNGAGLGIGDINGDGLADLFFAGNQVQNRLYLNKGNLQFEDITQQAGILDDMGWSTGVTMVDINQDGHLDIYVSRSGSPTYYDPQHRENLLYINNGDNTFSEKAKEYGVADQGYGTHAAFFDYDKDGDLDLYVLNHPVEWRNKTSYTFAEKLKQYDEFTSDHLYKNNGDGTFTDVSEKAGILAYAFGLSVNIVDINQDGWLDLYVANDYWVPDFLFINNRNGTFSRKTEEYFAHVSQFGMGSDIQDFNNDGLVDVLVVDMMPEDNYRWKTHEPPANYDKLMTHVHHGYGYQYKRNTLQLNNGKGQFSEIAQLSGLAFTDWSWASLFADFDNDGWKDVFIANGFRRDYSNWDFMQYTLPAFINEKGGMGNFDGLEVLDIIPVQKLSNYMYRNNGDLTFSKKTKEWGFEQVTFSNGAAYTDLDNDGDLDMVVNNINDKAFVYENHSADSLKQNYIQFELKPEKKDGGLGTQITLTTSKGLQYQQYSPYRGFMSTVDAKIHFGLGNIDTIEAIKVIWPDGKQQQWKNVKSNQVMTLKQEEAQVESSIEADISLPIFEDITQAVALNHRHTENDYNDFKREPLLPHMFSCMGPSLAVGDVNGDGISDVFFGASFTEKSSLYQQTPKGKFEKVETLAFNGTEQFEDLDAIFFDADGDGDQDLYVVSGSNEYDAGSSVYLDRLYFNDGKGNFEWKKEALPNTTSSGTCVKAGDYDKDGDLDLFVGGGILPQKYPFSSKSYLLQNDGGTFKDVTDSLIPDVAKIGLVKDAIWSDFNGDSQLDLIVVGEWMPICMFENNNGNFENSTAKAGLSPYTGWWNTIEAGDFDEDGDMDYVIGNLGLNSRIKGSLEEPATIHAKDFDENGSMDAIISIYIDAKSYPFPARDDMNDQMLFLKSRFLRYAEYATEGLTDIFSKEQLEDALILKGTTFTTSYLQNKGDGTFELSSFQNEVQTAPVNSILVEDFNADGHLDIAMVGNIHGSNAVVGRYDAGIGWYLEGKGSGSFNFIPAKGSGFYVPKDTKKMKLLKNPNNNNHNQIMVVKNNAAIQVLQYNTQKK